MQIIGWPLSCMSSSSSRPSADIGDQVTWDLTLAARGPGCPWTGHIGGVLGPTQLWSLHSTHAHLSCPVSYDFIVIAMHLEYNCYSWHMFTQKYYILFECWHFDIICKKNYLNWHWKQKSKKSEIWCFLFCITFSHLFDFWPWYEIKDE